MASKGGIALRAGREALAFTVFCILLAGVLLATAARRVGDLFGRFVPRAPTARRTSQPGRLQFDTVARALAAFAEEIVAEIFGSAAEPRVE